MNPNEQGAAERELDSPSTLSDEQHLHDNSADLVEACTACESTRLDFLDGAVVCRNCGGIDTETAWVIITRSDELGITRLRDYFVANYTLAECLDELGDGSIIPNGQTVPTLQEMLQSSLDQLKGAA